MTRVYLAGRVMGDGTELRAVADEGVQPTNCAVPEMTRQLARDANVSASSVSLRDISGTVRKLALIGTMERIAA